MTNFTKILSVLKESELTQIQILAKYKKIAEEIGKATKLKVGPVYDSDGDNKVTNRTVYACIGIGDDYEIGFVIDPDELYSIYDEAKFTGEFGINDMNTGSVVDGYENTTKEKAIQFFKKLKDK